jgi:predicted acetyltransferase
MLEVCRDRGIDPVLVTCDVDNEPSRRTIEGAGGVYENTREGKLRYWIPVS